ncbi:PhoU domain-containing protein [Actinomarinicola tropica]|uniref:PhoU domain-containing protein n=1 Tax=Actinomarinicola tropica TaxID=2789776 RepID=A0A5Q2RI27_9ACTN|nr:PhoU domain-containing protein [Actinomarinicola tropica]QGG93657.1 hypothetical protein GH723_00200 [Actinomarinicola tropica]
MVLSFFRRGESGMEQITQRVVDMLHDARHSFDLATSALVDGVPAGDVADDLHATDERINRAEQELRRELIVHVAVHGGDDIGDVLGYTLLIKKIERIGDQAKNIWDMAGEGVSFAEADDREEYASGLRAISEMVDEVAELIVDPDPDRIAAFRARADAMRVAEEARIREFMHSDEPGHWAVPRAVLHRYLKRVVANLGGVVTTLTEPVQTQDYFDEGRTDIDDD